MAFLPRDNSPYLRLNDDTYMPMLAFGTGTYWQKAHPEGPFDRDIVESFKIAIHYGYRHFDCAESYGTEAELGVAIKESGIPRQAFYITTKVCGSLKDIPKALEGSLKRLQTDYVNMFLVYHPRLAKTPKELQDAWKIMESLQRLGKTRSIGVCNFQREHMEAIFDTAHVKPAINHLEFHPYSQNQLYTSWLQVQGVQVASFFGLAPLNFAKPGPLDSVLKEIANQHYVNENAVLIRWLLDQKIASVSTSRDPWRLPQYLDAVDLELSSEELDRITQVGLLRGFTVQ